MPSPDFRLEDCADDVGALANALASNVNSDRLFDGRFDRAAVVAQAP
jgi:hypothetical protein